MPKKLHPTEQRAASRREGLLSLLSGAVAEPVAGLAGLLGLATGGVDKGVSNIEATRNALTYQPRDPSSLQALGRAVAPVADRIEAGKRWMGDGVLAKTGSPGLATAAHMVPDVLATLLGARGAGIKGPTMTQMAERSAGPAMGSPVSQIGAIGHWKSSPDALAMTREQFIGSPKITKAGNAADLKPKALSSMNDTTAEPFVNGLTVKYSPDGAAVFDGDKVVASYNFGDTLVVDKAYRRKGLAEELVYEWRTRYPAPAQASHRTKASQAIQEQVWDRIQREMRWSQ